MRESREDVIWHTRHANRELPCSSHVTVLLPSPLAPLQALSYRIGLHNIILNLGIFVSQRKRRGGSSSKDFSLTLLKRGEKVRSLYPRSLL